MASVPKIAGGTGAVISYRAISLTTLKSGRGWGDRIGPSRMQAAGSARYAFPSLEPPLVPRPRDSGGVGRGPREEGSCEGPASAGEPCSSVRPMT